ncbi:MAG: imidazoleglycerol-phosphate dehydratase [Candidatus Omnitrophica bacterium]|nr:imidazoleglycerol-phosphate dehydratase [Candidatus Omnitrophota bacterium]
MSRIATVIRNSNETEIKLFLALEEENRPPTRTKALIQTPIPLLNHMLELFTFHGFLDMELIVKGDTHIDIHHTNEDIGIVLGQAFDKALGNRSGITRFGSAFAPMESTLGHSVVDISGRGHLRLLLDGKTAGEMPPISNQGEYTFIYLEHFLDSLAKKLGANIIINIQNQDGSGDMHTIAETVFKSLGMALKQAVAMDPRRGGKVPSTKGIID